MPLNRPIERLSTFTRGPEDAGADIEFAVRPGGHGAAVWFAKTSQDLLVELRVLLRVHPNGKGRVFSLNRPKIPIFDCIRVDPVSVGNSNYIYPLDQAPIFTTEPKPFFIEINREILPDLNPSLVANLDSEFPTHLSRAA